MTLVRSCCTGKTCQSELVAEHPKISKHLSAGVGARLSVIAWHQFTCRGNHHQLQRSVGVFRTHHEAAEISLIVGPDRYPLISFASVPKINNRLQSRLDALDCVDCIVVRPAFHNATTYDLLQAPNQLICFCSQILFSVALHQSLHRLTYRAIIFSYSVAIFGS